MKLLYLLIILAVIAILFVLIYKSRCRGGDDENFTAGAATAPAEYCAPYGTGPWQSCNDSTPGGGVPAMYGSYVVSWTAPANCTAPGCYYNYVITNTTTNKVVQQNGSVQNLTSTNFNFTNFCWNTPYSVVITATNGAGQSPASDPFAFTTGVGPLGVQPGDVSVSQADSNKKNTGFPVVGGSNGQLFYINFTAPIVLTDVKGVGVNIKGSTYCPQGKNCVDLSNNDGPSLIYGGYVIQLPCSLYQGGASTFAAGDVLNISGFIYDTYNKAQPLTCPFNYTYTVPAPAPKPGQVSGIQVTFQPPSS